MAVSYAQAAGSSSTSVIDVNHQYYLHPSDNPGMVLITVTLNDHNYNQWCRSMRIALSSKLKLGFIDGTYLQPESTASFFTHWSRCNDIVISWLLNTVTAEIRQSVMYLSTAKAIWDDFKVKFAQTNVPKLFNLRRDIAYLTQGNLSITAYFTKFRSLTDELDALSEFPKCTCGKCTCTVNAQLEKFTRESRLSQFLMGLSDRFTGIRGHLLMLQPIPTLNEAYSLLIQEENQREISTQTSHVTESMSMAVKPYTPNQKFDGSKAVKRESIDKSTLYCNFCKNSGHTKDTCFCVHGFPSWHRLFGKPKPKPRPQPGKSPGPQSFQYQAHNAIENVPKLQGNDDNVVSDSGNGFTDSQCKQIMTLIQAGFKEMHHSGGGFGASNPSQNNWSSSINSFQHMAGPSDQEDYRDW